MHSIGRARSVAQTKPWACSVGHRRAHVIGGGSLPVRSPVIPVDCAKLHALWSVCMCERAPERGSRDLLNRTSAMPKPPPKALMPGGEVLGPSTLWGSLVCSRGRGSKMPKKERTLLAEEMHHAQSATRQK
jgi:hypothetical protein